ncbi:hypothetical protein HLH17_16370 [Acinetobacter sp. ANC 5380]|uniref:DNA helicase n=1 Tax=Acinetobacter terrae TaxID=2731247 RepID=A0A7Y2RI67_9GAMM|nr:hypothetical protein [Acinetobacter terrae]NNH79193.1 hypothetical protein [Acinetobacter terrae]
MVHYNQLAYDQKQCIDLAKQMKSFVIKGYSGCGKTESLISISHELKNKRGIYLTFNRNAIADVKHRLHKNMKYSSFHALAQNHVPSHFKYRKNNPMNMKQLGEKYQLNSFDIPYSEDYKLNAKHKSARKLLEITEKPLRSLTTINQMQMINEAIRSFCKSSDDQVEAHHFHRQLWMDEDHYNNLAHYLSPIAQQYWEDMIEPNSPLNISFDAQLKYWFLSNPVLDFDFILIDDYSEGYELLDKFIVSQNAPCFVAYDEFQMLNQWGEQSTDINNSDLPSVMLSESFQVGRNITSHINLLLSAMGANTPIHSNLEGEYRCLYKSDDFNIPDAIICQTSIGAFCEFVLNQQENPDVSYAVELNKHQVKMWLDSASKLMSKQRSYYPDFCVFASWSDVLECMELNKLSASFRMFVELIESHKENISTLYNILDRECQPKSNPDCLITTVELSKNAVFDSISLSEDFELLLMTDRFMGLNHQNHKKIEDIYLENWDLVPYTKDLALIPYGEEIHGILDSKNIVPELPDQLYRITDMTLNDMKSIYVAITSAQKNLDLTNAMEVFVLLDKLSKNLD